MADIGGFGALASGFSESFNAARKNKTLREQLRMEREDKAQQRQIQQDQFNQGMQFKRDQATQLQEYRQGQQELQQKQLELQKRTADVQVSGALMKVFDPSVPKPARGFLFGQIAKNLGIDPKSQEFKDTQKAFMAFDDGAMDSMRKSLATMMPDAQPGEITAFAQSIISGNMTLPQLTEAMGQLSTRKSQEAIIDGLTGADTPQAPSATATGQTQPPGSRLLSPDPMATQGGNLPVPGMPQTAKPAAAPAAGGKKLTPETARRKGLEALRAGNEKLGNSLFNLAKDLEGGGQQGTMGSIPSGYQVKTDEATGEKTMIPIAGSPAATEAAAAKTKEEGRKVLTENTTQIMTQDIGRALEDIGKIEEWAAGPLVAVRSKIPGDDYYNINQKIDSVKANISFDALQKMRENSPTGGALGNVSDRDLTQLEKTKGNIDITSPPDVLKDNLKRIYNMQMDLVHGTPEQIQKLVDAGKITPEKALPLMERHKLSFDNQGRPVKDSKAATDEPAATKPVATEDTPKPGTLYTDEDTGKKYVLGADSTWMEVR